MASIDLLDVNVWVALSVPSHPHHARALEYWVNEARPRVAFNSHTMLGLVRLTSSGNLDGFTLTVEKAWDLYRSWRRDPAVMFANEPARCNAILDRLVIAGYVQPRTWSDAYLAAFAEAGNLRLVSFDRDFSRFVGLNWLRLNLSG